MQLPFVLQSAETMKAAVAYLEPHMEKADSGGKGIVVLGHREGRRPRHRQEPRRHHPDQQRLHVYNLGIKIADQRDDREGARGERRRDRHERPPREVDDHHAREPAGAEQPRPLRLGSRDPRRRRAHSHVRRARPARGVRRSRLLRQGRVRGPAHDGHAGAGPQGRHPRRRSSDASSAVATCRRASRSSRVASRSRSPRAPTSRPTPRSSHPPFVGSRVAKGISLDDIAGVRERDGALPQPVAVPARVAARTTRTSRPASGRRSAAQLATAKQEGLLVPAAAWGYFPVNSEGERPRRVEGRHPHAGVAALPLPAPAQGAVPVDRRLLPPDRVRRHRLRGVPRRDDGIGGEREREGAVRGRQVPGLPACCTGSRSR